jgi:hypothetical protein
MKPRPALEACVREHVERLDRHCGRIVGCRVLLEPVDTLPRVMIELTVPGDRLVSSYQSTLDDVAAADADGSTNGAPRWQHALHEGFAAAGRVLQDHVGRHRSRARRQAGSST